MNSRMISSEGISCCGKSRQRDISYEHGCDRQLDRGTREALNRSTLARRWLCEMGCAKGDNANGATAKGGAVSSKGGCDPVAGCLRPNSTVTRSKHPRHCPIPASQGPSGYALGRSFARSLTKQTARKASSHSGCGKIGRDRAGRSSFFQRKMRPRSGLLAPHCTLPRSGIPAAARSPLRGGPRATLWGAMALRSLAS
jgi:hypothetical protein